MKYNNRNNPNKNIKVAKITILFIIISILVITVGNIVMQRFSNNTKTVQALDGNQNANLNQVIIRVKVKRIVTNLNQKVIQK